MAKKPLKSPSVPAGTRHSFFVYMQRLVVENGDYSTPQLGRLLDYSHQAIYKALTGPRMPSRAMTTNLAKVLGGETAVAAALQLWNAGVHEERGLSGGTPADLTSDEPSSSPTALDIARMMLGDNKLDTEDELARRRSLPAQHDYPARSALAAEIHRLTSEVGAVAEWFTADTTRDNLSDWMSCRSIPSLHNLMNFGYELLLGHEDWFRLIQLHTAAVAEASAETVRYATYLG